MKKVCSDVLVIGGGPAGIMAAVLACENRKVTLLEKPSRVNSLGKRILVSGNGRANFFNEDLLSENLFPDYEFLFRDDGHDYAKEFLDYLSREGFAYVREGKLYYPYFRRSECLHSFLMEKMRNVSVIYQKAVHIDRKNKTVFSEDTSYSYQDLVIATGGRSFDRKDFSYRLMDDLGVLYVPFRPMLCPVRTKEKIPPYLSKQRLRGVLHLLADGREIYTEEGELLFKEDGLSGIALFDSTKYLLDEEAKRYEYVFDYGIGLDRNVSLSCYPSFLRRYLQERGIRPGMPLRFTFSELYPFEESQASHGGIRLSEINPHTLSLKKDGHVYALGEMLDSNFICGGYHIGSGLIEGFRVGKTLEVNHGI